MLCYGYLLLISCLCICCLDCCSLLFTGCLDYCFCFVINVTLDCFTAFVVARVCLLAVCF